MSKSMHILLAVDGSAHAEAATLLVRDLALSQVSSISVLSVFPPRNASYYQGYERNVSQAVEKLADLPVELNSDVIAGNPAEVLTQYASEHKKDLIVMGARGLRNTLGILLGGVAQQVVEYADRPVLVVRAPYHRLQSVVLVTDGSPCGERAGDYLAHFPLAAQAEIEVLHILPPPPIPQSVLLAQTWPAGYERGMVVDVQEEREIEAQMAHEEVEGRQLLDRTCQRLLEQGLNPALGENLQTQLLRGDAATEIIEHLHSHETDLVVCGSRGLSSVRGWLLGSVSRKLLHYANCSVLVVRGAPTCAD